MISRRGNMKLVIANKNYSSWSLRPWLLLSEFDIPFEEIKLSLAPEGLSERIGQYSPSKRVLVLIYDELIVCDSLAICEYISEKCLDGGGWPENLNDRAEARSICAEMYSGFFAIREQMPMNCRFVRKITFTPEVEMEISRIDSIWSKYRAKNAAKGPWLFGPFSIADCFFAPVVSRFITYGVNLSDASKAYVDVMAALPSFIDWVEAARVETEVILPGEVGDASSAAE